MAMLSNLDNFFYPQSVAVVGATEDPSKSGHQILRNLLDFNFSGEIYPVNPKRENILGLKAYKDLTSIPHSVELVVITIPSDEVPKVMRQAADRGDVRAAVIIASGFAETKIPERVLLQQETVTIAKEAGIRIIGPNCVGVINTANGLNTTFAANIKRIPGNISFLSQSGAMGASILAFSQGQPIPMGFNKWAHVGNQADVNVLEVLKYYAQDKGTKVIAMYIEGIENGREFLKVVKEIIPEKSVVILKVGRSEVGSSAAASHTGSIVGSDQVYSAAFDQVGIIRVETLEDLLDTTKALAMQPLPKGNRIAVLTEAGGPGIAAVDELGLHSYIEMPDFTQITKERLKAILPPMALVDHARGYVDMSAAAMEHHHAEALQIILDDVNVDGVILVTVLPGFLNPQILAEKLLATLKEKPDKPVVMCILAGDWVQEACSLLEENSIPTFMTPERAARSIARLVQRTIYLNRANDTDTIQPTSITCTEHAIISKALAEKRHLLEPEAIKLITTYGLPTVPSAFTKTTEEAKHAASSIGYPVVLKVVSPDILHKTDAGAVRLNICNDKELEQAYNEILANSKRYNSQARIEGILVCKQATPGIETIIGGKVDPQFGPVIMFGLGGIFVEIFKDVVFRVAPITLNEARTMIKSIKGYPLLVGARGKMSVSIEALAGAIVKVSQLMLDNPEIQEVDLNPVNAYEQSIIVLDARIILDVA